MSQSNEILNLEKLSCLQEINEQEASMISGGAVPLEKAKVRDRLLANGWEYYEKPNIIDTPQEIDEASAPDADINTQEYTGSGWQTQTKLVLRKGYGTVYIGRDGSQYFPYRYDSTYVP